ncbi:hypothetical protein ACO1O0_005726 [Amphichorda felina]
MSLDALPDELLSMIALSVRSRRRLSRLAKASRRLHSIANSTLYRLDARKYGSSALLWAAEHGREDTARTALNWGASVVARKGNCTPIGVAARENHIEAMRVLLSASCDVGINITENPEFESELSPVFCAVENGNVAMVRLLLSDGRLDPGYQECTGKTPLITAVLKGHTEIVRLLLADKRVDPNSRRGAPSTPLIAAMVYRYYDIAMLLLAHPRLDPNQEDYSQRSALYWAIRHNVWRVMEQLLANPKVMLNWRGYERRTLLIHAVNYGRIGMVKLLLADRRVNPNATDWEGVTPYFHAARIREPQFEGSRLLTGNRSADPDARDVYGRPAPWRAAAGEEVSAAVQPSSPGDAEIMELFLSDGRIDPDARDKYGRTALSWAAGEGNYPVVQLLLARMANPMASDIHNRTPLWFAAHYGHESVVRLWLEATDAIDLNHTSRDGETPLAVAAAAGHTGVMEILLGYTGIGVNTVDVYGRTPLICALEGGDSCSEAVSLLQANGVVMDTTLKSPSGRALLWENAASGNACAVELLLEAECLDVNVRDEDGDLDTPLACAAKGGHEGVVRLLLGVPDIDVNASNKDGVSPLLHATRLGHRGAGVVELLLGADGIDLNARDNDGVTPLLAAIEHVTEDGLGWSFSTRVRALIVVKMLIVSPGIDIMAADNQGRTALTLAENLRSDLMDELLTYLS